MPLYTPFMERNVDKLAGARQQGINSKLAQSAYMGDPEAMGQLYGQNPQLAQQIEQQKAREQQNRLSLQAQQQKSQQDEQARQREFANSIKEDIAMMPFDQANEYVKRESSLAGITIPPLTPEYHEQIKMAYGGKQSKDMIGTPSPKDFDVNSLAEYEKTGDISVLKRYSPKTIKVAGVEHQLNPETQAWEPVIDVTNANLSVQAQKTAEIEADQESRKDFSKSKSKWIEGRPAYQSKINSAESSNKVLTDTISELKNNLTAATTEYGASLSGWPGSEARKVKNLLNTVKAHSAFGTLTDLKNSGGTLGAISAPELVLLEAKLGALDQANDTDEIIRVLDQIAEFNASSISRLKTEYSKTNDMFSGDYDDLQAEKESMIPQTSTGPKKHVSSSGIEFTVE